MSTLGFILGFTAMVIIGATPGILVMYWALKRRRRGNPMSAISDIVKIEVLALEALEIGGGHHKQWYLEQILQIIGYELEELQEKAPHDEGIAP